MWTQSNSISAGVHVSWDHCCFPVKFGGLGIKSLNLINKALLSKLAWKVLSVALLFFSFWGVDLKELYADCGKESEGEFLAWYGLVMQLWIGLVL